MPFSPCRVLAPACLAAIVVALAIFAALANPAGARQDDPSTPVAPPPSTPLVDAGPSFVIHPADGTDGEFFTLEAKAGSTHELTLVLGNADDEPLELRTFANDAAPMTNGGFAIAEEDIAANGTATWLDYPAETYTFDPGSGIQRTFTVTVPDSAEPGQYIAGIALQTAEPIAVEGSSLFNQIIRKAIAVFIVVPGPETPTFELGEPELITDGRVPQLSIPVDNTGNVLVKPRGELTLRNDAGETVLSAPIAMGSVYAGTTAPLSVGLRTTVPDGDYSLSVNLVDDATGATASLQEATITIMTEERVESPLALAGNVAIAPNAVNPAFADVALTVTNTGELVTDAEVALDVTKDGELVESFVLAPGLALPQGTTEIAQRYVPPTGWEPGSWGFVVRLNVVDPSSGTATTVATLDTIPPVEIGG